MVVIGAGTGGTVTGIGRKMKDKLPHVQVSKFTIWTVHHIINFIFTCIQISFQSKWGNYSCNFIYTHVHRYLTTCTCTCIC